MLIAGTSSNRPGRIDRNPVLADHELQSLIRFGLSSTKLLIWAARLAIGGSIAVSGEVEDGDLVAVACAFEHLGME